MKQSTKNQMSNMLIDVITHFQRNPKLLRGVCFGRCVYTSVKELSEDNIGCAIGMYLSESTAEKLRGSIETLYNISPELLPKWMRDMPVNFLQSVQSFHDTNCNWTYLRISEAGRDYLKDTCEIYDLPWNIISTYIK